MAAENPEAEVVIRRARAEDYEAVVEIGDVYLGRDYIKDMYYSFMDDPDIYPLVADINGKAIGFYFSHVIDDGLTVVKRAGRVHNSYRGQGIFHKLSEALDKHMKEAWPCVKHEAVGVTGTSDARAAREFQEKGFQDIVRKHILNLVFKLDMLKDLGPSEDFSRVTLMTNEDLRLLLSNQHVTNKLFPGQIILNWFIGYRIMESNVPLILGNRKKVFASTFSSSLLSSSLPSTEPEKSFNFTPEMIDNIDVLSFSHHHEGSAGLIYVLDMYTMDGFNETSLKSHLQKHFNELRRLTKGDGGVFMVTFHSRKEETVIMPFLKKLGIVDTVPGTETYLVWYEKKMTA